MEGASILSRGVFLRTSCDRATLALFVPCNSLAVLYELRSSLAMQPVFQPVGAAFAAIWRRLVPSTSCAPNTAAASLTPRYFCAMLLCIHEPTATPPPVMPRTARHPACKKAKPRDFTASKGRRRWRRRWRGRWRRWRWGCEERPRGAKKEAALHDQSIQHAAGARARGVGADIC
jgi:hypothetical protein